MLQCKNISTFQTSGENFAKIHPTTARQLDTSGASDAKEILRIVSTDDGRFMELYAFGSLFVLTDGLFNLIYLP